MTGHINHVPKPYCFMASQERNARTSGDHSPSKSALKSPSSVRKVPLLNLDGPPPDVSDSEVEQSNSNQTAGLGKKRRRRKKKKKKTMGQSVTESGEMTTSRVFD